MFFSPNPVHVVIGYGSLCRQAVDNHYQENPDAGGRIYQYAPFSKIERTRRHE